MQTEIIIIGAGPAGLQASIKLSELGHKVILIEQRKDLLNLPFKTLGSFIDIEEYGLSEKVIASPIKKGIIYSKNFKRVVKTNVAIIDKVQLHKELIQKAKNNGVEIIVGTKIKDVTLNDLGDIKSIQDADGNEYFANVFIDATGVTGILSKKFNLQEKDLTIASGLEYNILYTGNPNESILFIGKYIKGGYGWLFPLGNQRAILGVGTFDKKLIPKLKSILDGLFEINDLKEVIHKDNEHIEGGSIPVTDPKTKLVYKNLVCVGDSVSQVNPIAGEGYRFVLRSANIASQAIHEAIIHKDLDLLHKYEEIWRSEFYEGFENSRKLQQLINKFGKHEFLIDLGVLFLKIKRDSTVSRLVSGVFSKRDLFLP